MHEEIARILNVVLAMLIIAALWALATMRTSQAPAASEPLSKIETRNELSHA